MLDNVLALIEKPYPNIKLLRARRLVAADRDGLVLCEVCRVWYAPKRSNQTFCSASCRNLGHRRSLADV